MLSMITCRYCDIHSTCLIKSNNFAMKTERDGVQDLRHTTKEARMLRWRGMNGGDWINYLHFNANKWRAHPPNSLRTTSVKRQCAATTQLWLTNDNCEIKACNIYISVDEPLNQGIQRYNRPFEKPLTNQPTRLRWCLFENDSEISELTRR